MLWLSSSWSIKTWSRTKLRSSFCSVLSGLNTSGWRPSLPPETSWWLKIISRSQRSMNACTKSTIGDSLAFIIITNTCSETFGKVWEHGIRLCAVPVPWLVCSRWTGTAGTRPEKTSPLSWGPPDRPAFRSRHGFTSLLKHHKWSPL